jgi:hypothetical protein
VVATIENGQIVDRERRDKLGHTHFADEHHTHPSGERHGFDPAAQDRHSRMAATIADCQALICGGTLAPALRLVQCRCGRGRV